MKTRKLVTALSAALVGTALLSASAFAARPPDRPPGGGGGGEPEPTQGNNLSFPAISVDGYPITAITTTQFTVPYTGDYPGLTQEEIAALGGDNWYPQKTEGNTWQADYEIAASVVDVSYVDWGDNVESQNPKVGRPFRLEVQLYKQLNAWPWDGNNGMTNYRMAVLEYPSSSNELQGTNTAMYEGNFATVVSPHWKLGIQYCGNAIPAQMTWNGTTWTSSPACTNVPITFAVELNVGGKLIFGASEGGWKPKQTGWYRITFYSPQPTNLNLGLAEVGDYADFAVEPTMVPAAAEDGGDEGGVATPVVDGVKNISYVDVQVVGGGGGKGKPTASTAPTTKAAPTVTSARPVTRR